MTHAGPWLHCFRPRPEARVRLVCFPNAGGGAASFRSWPRGLPEAIEVWAARLPGRETRMRERPWTRICDLAAELASALETIPEGPFAVFGHSMGARLGFETLRELRRLGRPAPLRLFVAACRAPQVSNDRLPMHALPEADLLDRLRRFGGIPDEILELPEVLELMLPTLRADLAAYETYEFRPGPPLDCPISAFGGIEDDTVPHQDLLAWGEQTRVSFDARRFPGNHFFPSASEAALLDTIRKVLLADLGERPPER